MSQQPPPPGGYPPPPPQGYPQQPGYPPQQPPQGYPQQPLGGYAPVATAPMDHSLVTTAFTLPGYKITGTYGLVRGIVVRSRNVFAQIGAGFQTLFGGNISLYTELCEQTRRDSYELMMQHAAAVGANAVVGMRYDANEITSGVTEVLCYGTAVRVERE
jgi:uncharacterized protein YbjQ (UPF0145 family)